MCGRTATVARFRELYDALGIPDAPPDGGLARTNLAPSRFQRKGDQDSVIWEQLPTARRDPSGERQFEMMTWPLIPGWLKGALPNFSTANCRSEPGQSFSESIKKKKTFAPAWSKDQRCVIAVSWFYEWDQRTQPKQPWKVMPAQSNLLLFAGLWERSTRSTTDKAVHSCTIITTDPNQTLRDVGHHRAPVVLQPSDIDQWLNGTKDAAETLIAPPGEDWLIAEPVSRQINNPNRELDVDP